MFEYSKTILSKVSFDPALFGKELQKSIKFINKQEQKLLFQWCIVEFGSQYAPIIFNSFAGILI